MRTTALDYIRRQRKLPATIERCLLNRHLASDGLGIGVSCLEHFGRAHEGAPLFDGVGSSEDVGVTRTTAHVGDQPVEIKMRRQSYKINLHLTVYYMNLN